MTNRMGEKVVSGAQVIAGDYAPGQFIAGPSVLIHRRLGHGLSATVYEVESAMLYKGQVKPLGRRLALKVLHRLYSTDPEMIERLVAEATTLGNVRHPNVVQFYSAGFTQGEEERAYIVMELLDGGMNGRKLLDAQRGSRIPVQTVLEVALSLASGLAAVHAAGVVHQDIKPENIFVRESEGEEAPFCKIFDLGVQRKIASTGEPMSLGGTEEWSDYQGTPAYSAPEQHEGKPITPRTDIYAFGVLLFEFLTGKRPYFEAEGADRSGQRRKHPRTTLPAKSSPDEPQRGSGDLALDLRGALISAKLTKDAPRLSAHAIVPPRLESLVASCLERDPSRRPANAEIVEKELREILNELASVFKNHTQTTEQFLTSALRRAREQQAQAPPGDAEGPAIGLGPTPPLVPEMRVPEPAPKPERHPSFGLSEAGTLATPETPPVAPGSRMKAIMGAAIGPTPSLVTETRATTMPRIPEPERHPSFGLSEAGTLAARETAPPAPVERPETPPVAPGPRTKAITGAAIGPTPPLVTETRATTTPRIPEPERHHPSFGLSEAGTLAARETAPPAPVETPPVARGSRTKAITGAAIGILLACAAVVAAGGALILRHTPSAATSSDEMRVVATTAPSAAPTAPATSVEEVRPTPIVLPIEHAEITASPSATATTSPAPAHSHAETPSAPATPSASSAPKKKRAPPQHADWME